MKEKKFKIEYTRGTGPGGQHKNKVETCVVITHIATGLQERCQDSRSKNQNEVLAKKRLIAKMYQIELDKRDALKNEQRLDRIKNGRVIRTYNYIRNEVIDHRTKVKSSLKKTMNGELNIFINN